MSEKEVTTNEILEFLKDHMVMRAEFESEIASTRSELKTEISQLKSEVRAQKFELLDAMDEKNAALRGDIVVLVRGEDRKLGALVELLRRKHVLEEEDVRTILGMHPFPQIST